MLVSLFCCYHPQAPAKVVDKARADLKAQQDQLKTVQQAIVDLDA